VDRLRELGADIVAESPGREETVVFALPRELRRQDMPSSSIR